MTAFLLVLAVLVLLAAAVLALGGWRRLWDSSAARLARRAGLAPPAEEVLPRIARRERRATLAGLIGTAAGVAAVALVLAVAPPPPGTEGIELLSGIWAGAGVGIAVAAALDARDATPPGPRVARARAVALDDYLPGLERISARVLGFAALPVAAVVAVPAGPRTDLGAPLGLAVVALGSALLLELAGRRIVGRPQPAADDLALAWDDVLRARALLAMATAPIASGSFSLVLLLATVVNGASDSFDVPVRLAVAGTMLLLIAAATVALVMLAAVRRPQRYVLARLWPASPAAHR